jgi:hybrid cluster-associated redox disulfide protein
MPVTSTGNQQHPFVGAVSPLIRKNMRVADILTILPEAEQVFAQYGLHCSGCSIGGMEILEDAIGMHSMKEEDLNDLLADLHVLLSRRPARPQTITVTEKAAEELAKILEAEKKTGWTLQVGLDETGGFSLDIMKEPLAEDQVFAQHGLTVSAAPLTLAIIGGSTVDHRDGRFKLDLPEDAAKKSCACENGGTCACENGGECGCGGEKCDCLKSDVRSDR